MLQVMKKTPSHQFVHRPTNALKTLLLKKIASGKCPKGEGDKNNHKKKQRRYRHITLAIRKIHKAQRSTDLCLRKKPFRELVRQIADEFQSNTRMCPSALKALQEISEVFTIQVLSDAQNRRMDSLTDTDKENQIAVQVRGANVTGAFNVYTRERKAPFQTEFQHAVEELKAEEKEKTETKTEENKKDDEEKE